MADDNNAPDSYGLPLPFDLFSDYFQHMQTEKKDNLAKIKNQKKRDRISMGLHIVVGLLLGIAFAAGMVFSGLSFGITLPVAIVVASVGGLIISFVPVLAKFDYPTKFDPVIYPEFTKIETDSELIAINYTLQNDKKLELSISKNVLDNSMSSVITPKADSNLSPPDKKEIQKALETIIYPIIDEKIKFCTAEKHVLIKKQQALEFEVNNHLTETPVLAVLETQMQPLNKQVKALDEQILSLQTARESVQVTFQNKELNENIQEHALTVEACHKTIKSCKDKIANLEKTQIQYPALGNSLSNAKLNLEKTIAQAEETLKQEAQFSRTYKK